MKKYLLLFSLLFITACNGDSGSDKKSSNNSITPPTSIAGKVYRFIIQTGTGYFATSGSFTIGLSATSDTYYLAGETPSVADSAGIYTYTISGVNGSLAMVDSVMGVGTCLFTFLTNTSGKYQCTVQADPGSTQSGTFAEI